MIEAPHLAQLANQLHARPLAVARDPLMVDVETYLLARDEMTAIMRDRGFPCPSAADIGRPNFLLLGTSVCPVEH